MHRAHVISTVLLLLALPAAVIAQEVLTNQDVLTMHEAGLPASVILAKIQSTPSRFDTSVEALVALSKAGLPDEVLAAMTGGGEATAEVQGGQQLSGTLVLGQRAVAQPTVRTRFRDPHCPTPGVFIVKEDDTVTEVDPAAYSGAKTSGALKSTLTYGILSVKSTAMIQGLRSHNSAVSRSPTFYFCFEETESGLSYETSGATTPSQFLLVQLDVDEKQNARTLVTGKFNAHTGGYAGPPPKYRVDFTYEKVAPGVYKVMANGLGPGEYCFFYTGSASATAAATYGFASAGGGGKVFDFSVR